MVLGRRRPQRLEVELTARGLTVFWECAPGLVVRRSFTSLTLGCAAVEALREKSPATLQESLLLLDEIARSRPASHPMNTPGPSTRPSRSDLRHR